MNIGKLMFLVSCLMLCLFTKGMNIEQNKQLNFFELLPEELIEFILSESIEVSQIQKSKKDLRLVCKIWNSIVSSERFKNLINERLPKKSFNWKAYKRAADIKAFGYCESEE